MYCFGMITNCAHGDVTMTSDLNAPKADPLPQSPQALAVSGPRGSLGGPRGPGAHGPRGPARSSQHSFCMPLTADVEEQSMTRYMGSYMSAVSSSWRETLLQGAHAVKPAL